MKRTLGWHFAKDDGTNRDGLREEIGKWYRVKGKIVLCSTGLHGCWKPLDALEYAPGCYLRRTEYRGDMAKDGNKFCARERRVLWEIDATRVLHEFACTVAERALRAAKVTDERSWTAIRVKRDWLAGKATGGQLAAAAGAAAGAAWDAAKDAAAGAAAGAAWDAAGAAWDAAGAAWDAWDATKAAWDATKAAQNRLFVSMIRAARKGKGGRR